MFNLTKKKPLALFLCAFIIASIVAMSNPVAQAHLIVWQKEFNQPLVTPSDLGVQKAEAAVQASQSDTQKAVTAYREDVTSTTTKCRISTSSNGGDSWSTPSSNSGFLPLPSGTTRSVDPVLAISGSTWYAVCLATSDASYGTGDKSVVYYSTSTDNGATWSGANIVKSVTCNSSTDCPLVDKPWIEVSGSNIYVAWVKYDNFIRTSQGFVETERIMFKRIGGSELELASGTTGAGTASRIVQAPNIVVNSNGVVYVVWSHLTSNTAGAIELRRSFNNGGSFDSMQVVNTFTRTPVSAGNQDGGRQCADPFGCVIGITVNGNDVSGFRVPNFPSVDVDRLNNLHVAHMDYTSNSGSKTDIKYVKGTNCTTSGQTCTFTSINVLNDGGVSKDQFLPSLVVSKKSDVIHILAYDRRDSSDNTAWKYFDYHCHFDSNNNSCTSANQWTSKQTSSEASINYNGVNFIGDYYTATSNSLREAIAIWEDSRVVNLSQQLRIFGDRTAGGIDIYAEDCTGTYINGMAVSLYDSTGNLIQSGFTPMYVPIHNTGNYMLKYSNYGSNIFVDAEPRPTPVIDVDIYSWGGDVSLSLTDTDAYDIDGIYNTSGGNSCGSTGTISVTSIDQNSNTLTGLYMQLTDTNNNQLDQGWTPVQFTRSPGTYKVWANDYCNPTTLQNIVFNQWTDGTTTRDKTVSVTSGVTTYITAKYDVSTVSSC